METFLKNYWSLYNDFLIKFDNLVYKGFSIPYLCHFPSFITRQSLVWKELYQPSFTKYIEHEVKDQAEFQQKFNQFMASHTKLNKKNPSKKGKVVIHLDKLLRFPPSTFVNSFNNDDTLILITTENKIKTIKSNVRVLQTPTIDGSEARKKYGVDPIQGFNKITTIALNHYYSNIDGDITKVIDQAQQIIDSYKNHRVYGSADFRQWLFEKIKAVMHRIIMTEKFLKANTVSCFIVSTTHSYVNRILAVIGARRGIPTICMQHGIMSSELGYIPKIATIDAMYGQFEKDWYGKLGIAENSVQITGHPRFDQINSPPSLSRKQFYHRLQLDMNRKTLLLIVRGNKDMEKWRTLIQTLTKKHKLNILVKNYPSKRVHPFVKEFSFVHPTQSLHLYELFPHVDFVVAYSSTVALEAMLAKKHVFILKDDFEGYTEYYASLGNIVQETPQQLAPYISKYLTRPHFKAEIERRRENFLRYAYPEPKNSEGRLKELVRKITI